MKKNRATIKAEPAEPEKTELTPITAYELATLAARICPGICEQDPAKAIEAATDLMTAAASQIEETATMKELERMAQAHDEEIGTSVMPFGRGVKYITDETVMTRAMPWFRKFVRSRANSDNEAEAAIIYRRAVGFAPLKAGLMRDAFAEWKAKEKSRSARESATASKKKSGKPKK